MPAAWKRAMRSAASTIAWRSSAGTAASAAANSASETSNAASSTPSKRAVIARSASSPSARTCAISAATASRGCCATVCTGRVNAALRAGSSSRDQIRRFMPATAPRSVPSGPAHRRARVLPCAASSTGRGTWSAGAARRHRPAAAPMVRHQPAAARCALPFA
ncbi:hypothetical protein G6F61_013837 [Rhizopus arrhizus]|nr:hypothetical protein G6F61_013837 [Rhizopus arrhizus]